MNVIMKVPDECYYRNSSCALSTYLCFHWC